MTFVYLNDSGIAFEQAEEHFAEAAAWASRQCASYIDYYVQDVADVSYDHNFIGEYRFTNAKDALMFELKWKTVD